MKTTVFIDFDRTAFDTKRFLEVQNSLVEEHLGIPREALKMPEDTRGNNIHDKPPYNLFKHLRALSVDEVKLEELKMAVMHHIGEQSFIHADLEELLNGLESRFSEATIRILTFGVDEYQFFKREFAPELKHLDFYVTSGRKSEFLNHYYKEFSPDELARYVLIDDNPDSFVGEFNAGYDFLGLRVKRGPDAYDNLDTPEGIIEVASLPDVLELLPNV